ncbi:hypothetical protein [Rhizobium leguminosarum]|uniref:hypothetical protein n=1 Tax=Rhizobium leguminosarum TaxID=384 RepID=UPI00103D6F94|nr:hypothetical protein [Rhizobium leguminosarum]TBZ72469.1 hypothetical protein E0H43_17235 [Rhizobium leguminosarum bv. viciae]
MKKGRNELACTAKAIIDCRIFSPRQKIERHGLESQEQGCRQYAELHGYEVKAVSVARLGGKR